MSPNVVDKRHMTLQTWFTKVLQSSILGTCADVVQFLEENKFDEGLVELEVIFIFTFSLLFIHYNYEIIKCKI